MLVGQFTNLAYQRLALSSCVRRLLAICLRRPLALKLLDHASVGFALGVRFIASGSERSKASRLGWAADPTARFPTA